MSCPARHATACLAGLLMLAATTSRGTRADTPASPRPAGRWRDSSFEDYRKHLVELETLTQACAAARDVKTCDPMLVGLDDRVPVGSRGERRLVRFGWLRVLFSRAEESDQAQQAAGAAVAAQPAEEDGRSAPRTTSELLKDAEARLRHDLAQAHEAVPSGPSHAAESAVLQQVLAEGEFRSLKRADVRDSMLERLNRWLNRIFEGADRLSSHSAWVGRALIWSFLLGFAVALAWWLMQLERRWRVRLVSSEESSAASAPSAQNWQLWMADARAAATQGRWREAIHSLYWGVITRLESKRLWPADSARTPREYLALVPAGDARRPRLALLTRTFERSWYGGNRIREEEYRRAENLAIDLLAGADEAQGLLSLSSERRSEAR